MQLTPQQTDSLTNWLCATITSFQQQCKALGLDNLSVHLSPDGSWIALEHDAISPGNTTGPQYLVRKSPACHEILLKI